MILQHPLLIPAWIRANLVEIWIVDGHPSFPTLRMLRSSTLNPGTTLSNMIVDQLDTDNLSYSGIHIEVNPLGITTANDLLG